MYSNQAIRKIMLNMHSTRTNHSTKKKLIWGVTQGEQKQAGARGQEAEREEWNERYLIVMRYVGIILGPIQLFHIWSTHTHRIKEKLYRTSEKKIPKRILIRSTDSSELAQNLLAFHTYRMHLEKGQASSSSSSSVHLQLWSFSKSFTTMAISVKQTGIGMRSKEEEKKLYVSFLFMAPYPPFTMHWTYAVCTSTNSYMLARIWTHTHIHSHSLIDSDT